MKRLTRFAFAVVAGRFALSMRSDAADINWQANFGNLQYPDQMESEILFLERATAQFSAQTD